MEINIVSHKQKDSWNDFVIENNGSFLQSFEWGEFQEKSGNKIFRVQAKEGSKVLAQALVINHKFPLGLKNYFYIPYGPCFKNENALKLLFQYIKDLAKKQGAVFLRIEPYQHIDISTYLNIKMSAVRIQPKKTLIKDITKTEQELQGGFDHRVRYNINLAKRKGVLIEFKDDYKPEFFELMKKTRERNKFHSFSEKRYKAFFDIKSDIFKIKMCLAKYQEKIVAANILVLFNKRAIVLHGASDIEFRALKATNLLQWEQMKMAKQMGCDQYDFWGIDEKKWPGVTHFKKSFGGREVTYPQAEDIVYSKILYKAYKLANRLK